MLPPMKLNGTAAIISGGASGLGAAVARRLAAAGATAVVADLNEEHGKAVAAETGGLFVKTDVADENSVTAAVEAAVATGAPLRTVVSCAGIGWAARTVGRDGTPHDLASYRKVIDINLIGTFNLMRIGAAAIAQTEPADADNQRGVVINTASVAGLEGQTGQVAYSASKGGIIGMTVPAARDLAAIGVRVNTICPGIIDTPIYGFDPTRGVQGQAGRAGGVPQADGHRRRVRPPGPGAHRERLHERRGHPVRRRDPVPAQVAGPGLPAAELALRGPEAGQRGQAGQAGHGDQETAAAMAGGPAQARRPASRRASPAVR